ncbi:hypothetical protein ABK040_003739 [Willaertia magna]
MEFHWINNETSNFHINKIIDIKTIKFLSNGDDFISIVTNENIVYVLIFEKDFYKLLKISNNYCNNNELPQFGKIIYLKSLFNVTIIVNDELKVFEIEFNDKHLNYEIKEIKSLQNLQIKFIRGYPFKLFFVIENDIIIELVKLTKYRQTIKKTQLKIKDLQCSKYHSILLTKKGTIYGMGDNSDGQLGFLENKEIRKFNEFCLIPLPFKVKKITCYNEGTILLNEFNELFGCGKNENGELPGLKRSQIYSFTKIVMNSTILVENVYGTCFEKNYNIIVTKDNEIYISGVIHSGLKLNNLKYNELENIYYLDKFTKIEFASTKKYLFPLLLKDNVFIIECDDKKLINCVSQEEDNMIGLQYNCYLKLKNNCLCDIIFY